MTEFQAKKVYLRNEEGDYIAPVAYSAKYSASGTDLDGFANKDLSNLSTTGNAKFANKDLSNLSATGEAKFVKPNIAVTHTANTAAGTSSRPVYVNSSGVATACSGIDVNNLCCTSRTTISSTKPDVIIAQYQSGTSGYRVWASGFKEKWGRISVSSNTGDVAVTFNTTYPFTTTPVVLTTVVGDNAHKTNTAEVGGGLIQAYAGNINRASTTGFYFSYCYKGTTNVNTHNYSWYACGY